MKLHVHMGCTCSLSKALQTYGDPSAERYCIIGMQTKHSTDAEDARVAPIGKFLGMKQTLVGIATDQVSDPVEAILDGMLVLQLGLPYNRCIKKFSLNNL